MTVAFDFHPEAQAEFAADVDWYDDREDGLGGRFAEAVRAAVEAAVDAPDAWAPWTGWDRVPVVRSKGVSGFPYTIVYFVDGDMLTILAVAHAKRLPGYWSRRLSL